MQKKQLERLSKLADFLETEIGNKQFNMEKYRAEQSDNFSDNETNSCSFIDKNNCGTIGCALGWGPFVTRTQNSDFTDNYSLDWHRFSKRAFGLDLNNNEASYLFSGDWAKSVKGKTRMAAVKRIRAVVSNGGKLSPQQKGVVERLGL